MDSIYFVIAGTVLAIISALIIILNMNKYHYVKELLDDIRYKDDYLGYIVLGMSIIDIFKIEFDSESRREVVLNSEKLYGKGSGEILNFYFLGIQITIIMFGIIGGLLFSSSIAILPIIIIALSILISYNITYNMRVKINNRNDILMLEFPAMISKFTLLVSAGGTIRDSWEKIAITSEGYIYREMKIALDDMNNGVSEIEAIMSFAQRCELKEIKNFANLIMQTSKKGGTEFVNSLKFSVTESWNEKRNLIIRKAQTASQKLLVPSGLIFLGILIIVVGPLLGNGFF
ncbi:MAG: hypothetical protein Q4A42_07005 [Tissierellia bacterium]|nr:hypothetical protein [Tissierellia bacterium]